MTVNRPSRSTYLIVVFVIFILILLNSLVVHIVIPDAEEESGGPPEDQPWNSTVEVQLVKGDETWTGRVGDLERPVEIRPGARLRLVECDLGLRLDDILQFRRPYFMVEEGGTLELEGTKIHITADPWLMDSMCGPINMDRNVPSINRVVDLVGAADPRLCLDLMWREGGVPLVVYAQRSPDGPLERVAAIDPSDPRPHEWRHHEVSLARYVGLRPRIVIAFERFPDDILMIHNLTVLGGAMERSLSDQMAGWRSWGWSDSFSFLTWDNAYQWYCYKSNIIQSHGTVRLMGAELTVPNGVPRGPLGWAERLPNDWGDKIFHGFSGTAYRGLGISATDGTISIQGSTLVNVPVSARDARLDFARSTFRSEEDALSFDACSGTIESSRIEYCGPSQPVESEFITRACWGLNIENNTHLGPLRVLNCTFVDSVLGLDMAWALVEVENCTFRGVNGTAIWDHQSQGFGCWTGLVSSNRFEDCMGDLYLRTTMVEFVTVGGTVEQPSVQIVDSKGNLISALRPCPRTDLVTSQKNSMYVLRPNLIVDAMGVERGQTSISIQFYVGGEHLDYSTQDPGPLLNIDLNALMDEKLESLLMNPIDKMELDSIETGALPGNCTLFFSFPIGELYTYKAETDFLLDGEEIKRIDMLEEAGDDPGWSTIYNCTIPLTAGLHELNVRVLGAYFINETTDGVVELSNRTYHVLLVDGGTPPAELREALEADRAIIVLAAGMAIDIDGLTPPGQNTSDQHLFVIGPEGTSMHLRYLRPEPWPAISFTLDSGIDLEIEGLSTSVLSIAGNQWWLYDEGWEDPFSPNDLRLLDSSITELTIGLPRGNVSISNVTILSFGYINNVGGERFAMDNVSMSDCQGFGVSMGFADVLVEDCRFQGSSWRGLNIDSSGTQSIAVRRCGFIDSSLWIGRVHSADATWSLDVSGCTFGGEGSVMVIGPKADSWTADPTDAYDFTPPTGGISGNSFTGHDDGAILHSSLCLGFLDDNSLSGGARCYAWCVGNVTAGPQDADAGGTCTFRMLDSGRFQSTIPFPIEWKRPSSTRTMDPMEVFVDLTDRPSSLEEVGEALIYVLWASDHYHLSIISDFVGLDPFAEDTALRYRTWPDIDSLLIPLYDDWPWPMPVR